MAAKRLSPLTLLLLAIAPPVLAAEQQAIDFSRINPADHASDRWYLDLIDDRPAGYWHEWLKVEEGRLYTGYETYAAELQAGEKTIRRMRVEWVETARFEPISIRVEQSNASDTIRRTYRFTETGIDLTSEQDGREIKERLAPIEVDYLTAAQEHLATSLYLSRGVESFELRSIDPLVGMMPAVSRYEKRKDAKDLAKIVGQKQSDRGLTQWSRSFAILPGFEMRVVADDRGEVVGLSYETEGMMRVSRLADASVVDTEFDPPEMSHRSVVVPDRAIENLRKQRKIVYELTYDSDDEKLVPVETAQQRVEFIGPGRVRVTVDLDAEQPERERFIDKPTDAHLAATIRVDHEDPAVRALALEAVRGHGAHDSSQKRAEACKQFVSATMRSASLTVGDATASEVARSRRGDCTEYSVLLAALLRANGIPSRCVNGLVYSESGFAGRRDVFVRHQWTQAWIEDEAGAGRWVDLDAAQWRYSAGHLALVVSDMGESGIEDQLRLIPLTRGLAIKVIQMDDAKE